jgi:hypothetical protein
MTKLTDLTSAQIQRAIDIKLQIETLQNQLDSIDGGNGSGMPSPFIKKKKRRMSRAGRAAIAAAARARWAKIKGNRKAKVEKPAKKRRKMSAAARAKMAAFARARWAKAKAAGKKAL